MKKGKILYLSLFVLIVALLCGIFAIAASADTSGEPEIPQYDSGFLVDGVHVQGGDGVILDKLVDNNPKKIICYEDLYIGGTSAIGFTTLEIDLNGKKLIQSEPAAGLGTDKVKIIRPASNNTLTVKNGTIEQPVRSAYVFYLSSNTGVTLIFDNCTINAEGKWFVNHHSGTGGKSVFQNGTVINFSSTAGAFDRVSASAAKCEMVFDGVTVNSTAGSSPIVDMGMSAGGQKTLTIKDSTFNVESVLQHAKSTGDGTEQLNVTIDGNTKLTFNTFMPTGNVGSFENRTYTLGPNVKFNKNPEQIINYLNITGKQVYAIGANEGDDKAEFPYATVKPAALAVKQDDTKVFITDDTTFSSINSLTPKKLSLFKNYEIDAYVSITKDVEINLNGYTLSQTADKKVIRPSNGVSVTFIDGTLVQPSGSDNLFSLSSNKNTTLTFDNCTINAAGKWFVNHHSGTGNKAIFKNGTVINYDSTTASSFARVGTGPAECYMEFDNVTVNGAANTIIDMGMSQGAKRTVKINNSTFKVATIIMHSESSPEYVGTESLNVYITGDTKLEFTSFVGSKEGTSPNKFYHIDPGVKFSQSPDQIKDYLVVNYEKLCFIEENMGEDKDRYPYATVNNYFCTVVDQDDKATYVTETKNVKEIFAMNPKEVYLYKDIMLDANAVALTDVIIYLNGNTLTQGGEITSKSQNNIRPAAGKTITIKNGTVVHPSNSYGFVFYSNNDSHMVFDKCNIISDGKWFINYYSSANSTTVFKNETVISATLGNSFIRMASSDKVIHAGATFDGVTFTGTAAAGTVFEVGMSSGSTRSVVINNSVITTAGNMFKFSEPSVTIDGYERADISITGETKLSFKNFIDPNEEGTYRTKYFCFGLGVKLTAVPSSPMSVINFEKGASGFAEIDDEAYPFVVTAAPTLPFVAIEKTDGTVEEIMTSMTFEELIELVESGSTITIYGDISLTKAIAEEKITDFVLNLNLNGYSFINSGAPLRAFGNSVINIYGGVIVDAEENYTFVIDGANVVYNIKDCNINLNSTLAQIASGALVIKDSSVSSSAGTIADIPAASTCANLSIEDCLINLGTGSLVSFEGSTSAAERAVTLIDSDVKTTGSLATFTATDAVAEGTVSSFEVVGNSRINCASIDGGTNAYSEQTFAFGLGVKLTVLPEITVGKIAYVNADGVIACDKDGYTYEVVKNIVTAVKPQFALTLYTDFTLNLCFSDTNHLNVKSVKLGEHELTPVKQGKLYIYQIAEIAPQRAAEAQEITIEFVSLGKTETRTIEYSIIDYANTLLELNYSIESKQMIARAIDYIVAVYNYKGNELPQSIKTLISAPKYTSVGNDEHVEQIPASDAIVGNLGNVLAGVKVIIGDSVKYRFYLDENIGSGDLTVKATVASTYTVENSLIDGKNYFDVNMRAYDFYNGKVKITYGEHSGEFDFKAYANCDEVQKNENENLKPLVVAMYNYFREANEYKMISNKDYSYASDSDGRLKILCVGNSYTLDTTRYVVDIIRDLGIDNVTLGHLYIANCSVERHYYNITEGRELYRYTVNTDGNREVFSDYHAKDAIESENWDYIVIQHKSIGYLQEVVGGTAPEKGNQIEYFNMLVDLIKSYKPEATLVWNMSWSKQASNGNTEAQISSYETIVSKTHETILVNEDIQIVNPIGTAIQNARTSYFGDTMNRDGAHLSYGMGCYTAGLAFVGSITGLDVSEVQWRPTEKGENEKTPITLEEQKVAIESAVNALKNPYEITESVYKTAPNN